MVKKKKRVKPQIWIQARGITWILIVTLPWVSLLMKYYGNVAH